MTSSPTPDLIAQDRLVEGAAVAPSEAPPVFAPAKAPAALVAVQLIAEQRDRDGVTVLLTTSERRADEIGRALNALADPEAVEVLVLPPWDCLPYDRASPSREVQGRRLAVLARLIAPGRPSQILVLSPEAAVQRIPPQPVIEATFTISVGDALDREALAAFAARTGYVVDDRIDEAGEIALLGEVIDVFPPAATGPVRIALEDDRVTEIRQFDPVSQRSEGALEQVVLTGASELNLDPEVERVAGDEHRMAATYGSLDSVFSLLGGATLLVDGEAADRRGRVLAQVEDAWSSRRTFSDAGETPLPAPAALYLTAEEADAAMTKAAAMAVPDSVPTPGLATEARPGKALETYVTRQRAVGRRVVLTGLDNEQRLIGRMLKRQGLADLETVNGWAEALDAAPGALLALVADLDRGFDAADLQITVVTATDVFGGRVAQGGAASQSLIGEPELRVGDVVIHEDHGLGVLAALERVEVEGAERDVIRLEYHGGATVLAPVEEFGRIWRYGSEPSAVTLDRLNTDGWRKRRAEVSLQIDATAARLVELVDAQDRAKAEPIVPPRAAYQAFAQTFPFPESTDQAAAIDAVLADLASGRPMNRLVCGDVGFGKTEVALRAAAAVALSGRQVLVAAPTTVLARQHAETFARRFAGTGIAVAHLSRLVEAAEARQIKAGLASGDIRIVIGTHALGADDLVFADLGLTIIDEEQRFGAKMKAALQDRAPHRLIMTATPIPRTLQAALVGLQDVSVIASPPARRRPIRTFLTTFDGGAVRTALLRERQRGGQSFVVVPRIEDMGPMAETLARLLPELTLVMAHGQMSPAAVDEAMVGFADGRGDVLLATNIIESGLDVPRANTMVVSRPDRFGLAQLHQLRGRVGRGRRQGFAYLLTEPDTEVAPATLARLGTLEALDRLGSGFAISARDLDLRGGGDLVGDEQAGHMRLIGSALYQRILERAVRVARGEAPNEAIAPLRLEAGAGLSEAYIPDATIRINLYARLARVASAGELEALADEIADRFGPPPEDAAALLDATRLAALAAEAGVTRIVTGPKATAFTVSAPRLGEVRSRMPDEVGRRWVEDRLVVEAADGAPHDPAFIATVLSQLAA